MTEALPMAVTALLPVVMMPWLDVMSSKQLCQNYLKVSCCYRLLSLISVMRWNAAVHSKWRRL